MTNAFQKIISLLLSFCIQVQPPLFASDVVPKDLGAPTAETYSENNRLAGSVWDMEVSGDVIYIGAGDYSANTGPTPIWAYNTDTQTWSVSTTVKDESVCRFLKTDATLIVPGIDSTEASWKYGNYHTLTDGQWTSFEKLPKAVHNFDVVHFAGKTFFATGTADGKTSPVLVREDGAEKFQRVPICKDGKSIFKGKMEYTRVYDFFVINGELYCLLATYTTKKITRMFCRYNGKKFLYVADADLDYVPWKQIPVLGKTAVGDCQYFTTGRLYKTTDFTDVEAVDTPDGGVVTDLYPYREGGLLQMYVLSNTRNEDGTFTATVYAMDNGFTALASYTAQIPALSMVRHGQYFYIGLGGSAESEATGKVIRLRIFDHLFA